MRPPLSFSWEIIKRLQSNQFSFYRIPRQLITGDRFKRLSTDTKLLYGLLLDRMGLSAKNGWYDEQGRVYIYYTLDEIREKVVNGLVLEGLQRLLWYIQVYEKRFAQDQMERFGLQEKKTLIAKRGELDKAKNRVAEIDQLIQKSYEDMNKGLLSEERFTTLTVSLENEQRQLRRIFRRLKPGWRLPRTRPLICSDSLSAPDR